MYPMKNTIKTLIFTGLFSGLTACTGFTEISSSTSSTTDAVTPDITLNNFIDKRFDAIRKDAATGGGENIEALAQLMGKTDPQALANFMQSNYEQLFSNVKQPAELIARMEQYGYTPKG